MMHCFHVISCKLEIRLDCIHIYANTLRGKLLKWYEIKAAEELCKSPNWLQDIVDCDYAFFRAEGGPQLQSQQRTADSSVMAKLHVYVWAAGNL